MMNNITDVVKNLLILNVIVFVGVSLTEQTTGMEISQYFKLYFPASPLFKPVQLVTHMFMHGGLSHLLFNMLGLFFLGPYVERRMGSQRFLLFYLLCGAGSMLAHIGVGYIEYMGVQEVIQSLTSEQVEAIASGRSVRATGLTQELYNAIYSSLGIPVVGASGAIYGVFLAFAAFFPNMKLMLLFPPIPIKAKFLVAGLVAIDLFSGISGQQTGIAHFAHLGGALAGLILVSIWYGNPFKQ